MQLSEQLILVLDELCKRFGIAIDWTAQNILPYLQEIAGKIVRYEIAKSSFWVLFAIAAIFSVCKLVKRIPKYGDEWDREHDSWSTPYTIAVSTVPFIVFALFVIALWEILNIIKCVFFPEAILYGYILRLL